jgi:glutathione S-transferase
VTALPSQPIRLYRHPLSGHAHRVELFLSLLGLPFERVEVDLARGAQREPRFLALNPLGEVPVIEDGGVVVADSLAILVYLAARYDAGGRWHPRDPAGAAAVQRWFAIAAGQLVQGPNMARMEAIFRLPRDPKRAAIAARVFHVMDAHLATRSWLTASGPTLADLALYTYTAHSPEGGIGLEPYPSIRAWLSRVEGLPGFVGMQRSPIAEPLVGP